MWGALQLVSAYQRIKKDYPDRHLPSPIDEPAPDPATLARIIEDMNQPIKDNIEIPEVKEGLPPVGRADGQGLEV